MAKKNKKKDKKRTLVQILKESKDKIVVFDTTTNEKSALSDMIKNSIDGTTSCETSSIIPVSASEAAEKKEAVSFSIESRFAKHVFSMYEEAMRNINVIQTICVTVAKDEAEDIFEYGSNPTISVLLERSNLGLIIKKAEKMKNRLSGWLENDADESFIINIPKIVFFSGNIVAKETTPAVLYNLTLQVLPYTSKELAKMRKKNNEKANKVQKENINQLVTSVVALGNASCDILVCTDEFITDIHDYIEDWKLALSEDIRKCLNKVIFSFEKDTDFIPASRELRDWQNNGFK